MTNCILIALFLLSTLTFAAAGMDPFEGTGRHETEDRVSDHLRHHSTQNRVLSSKSSRSGGSGSAESAESGSAKSSKKSGSADGGSLTITNSNAKPTGIQLGKLNVAWWKDWVYCGGDGPGGEQTPVWQFSDCPKHEGVPQGWVFFASGSAADATVERSCTVSKHDHILIPAMNTASWMNTLEEAIEQVTGRVDAMITWAKIDGEDVETVRLFGTYESFDSICLADIDVAFELNPGETMAGYPFAASGIFVAIKPLPKESILLSFMARDQVVLPLRQSII